MSKNHNATPQDHSFNHSLPTLKEVKSRVESTAGHRRPTPKHLREYETLLVQKEMDGCRLEVYTCGFAIYQTAYHYTVLRMEETGKSEYHSVTEKNGRRVNTENMDWTIGVMLCGEDRIETEAMNKASARLVSMTQTVSDKDGSYAEQRQMEFDANINIERFLVQTDIIAALAENLSERQKEVFHMYYFQEMRQREIAGILNIDQSAVSRCIKAISNKAKNFLREFII